VSEYLQIVIHNSCLYFTNWVNAEFPLEIIQGNERLLLTCYNFHNHLPYMSCMILLFTIFKYLRNRICKFCVICCIAQNWLVLLQCYKCWLINLCALWARHNLFSVKWYVNSSYVASYTGGDSTQQWSHPYFNISSFRVLNWFLLSLRRDEM
jgi:hypothetical protein